MISTQSMIAFKSVARSQNPRIRPRARVVAHAVRAHANKSEEIARKAKGFTAAVLTAGLLISPLEGIVAPAYADDGESPVERRARMRASRLAQVDAERIEREAIKSGTAPPVADAPPPKVEAPEAPKMEIPTLTAPEIQIEMPQFEMPKFSFSVPGTPSAPEPAPAAESSAPSPADKLAESRATAQRLLEEQKADQKAAQDKAATERAAAEKRAQAAAADQASAAEKAEKAAADQAAAAKIAADKKVAALALRDELAAEQRKAQREAGKVAPVEKKAPKNFANPEKKAEKKSGPGLPAFALGRIFETAYVSAVLLALKEYLSKGNVEVSDLQAKLSKEFGAIDNKPVAVAYIVAGLFAVSTFDFIFNAPVLNFIFPNLFQAVGILTAAGLYVTYKEGGDPEEDLKTLVSNLASDLPGLSSGESTPAPPAAKSTPPPAPSAPPANPPPAPVADDEK